MNVKDKGAITCADASSFLALYKQQKLPMGKIQKLAGHIHQCPHCQKRFPDLNLSKIPPALLRILSQLAILPDGMRLVDAQELWPRRGPMIIKGLCDTKLVFKTGNDRLYISPLVRFYVLKSHPCPPKEGRFITAPYIHLAIMLGDLVQDDPNQALLIFKLERKNIEAALRQCYWDMKGYLKALESYMLCIGHLKDEDPRPTLQRIRKKATVEKQFFCLGTALKYMGNVAMNRREDGKARSLYNKGALAFKDALKNSTVGVPSQDPTIQKHQAECYQKLGELDARHPEHKTQSPRHYQKALALYVQGVHAREIATCYELLGKSRRDNEEYDEAISTYMRAIPLFLKLNDLQGSARMKKSLGEISLELEDLERAGKNYREALDLYEQVRDIPGSIECTRALAEIAVSQSRESFLRGSAHASLNKLGKVKWFSSILDHDLVPGTRERREARDLYLRTLHLYQRAPDVEQIGLIHMELAKLSVGDQRQEHIDQATELWTENNRGDLIQIHILTPGH